MLLRNNHHRVNYGYRSFSCKQIVAAVTIPYTLQGLLLDQTIALVALVVSLS